MPPCSDLVNLVGTWCALPQSVTISHKATCSWPMMNVSDFSRPSARDNVTGMSNTTDQLSAKFNAFKSKFSDFVSQRRRHAGYGVSAPHDDVV
jgi:hypothetical protein